MRLSYAGLSRRLTGHPIPELGLRRIEKGERRVDVDDLLALYLVLEITPVDLLVPKDADASQRYQVAPKATARASNVREWIRGEDVLFYRTEPDQDEPETHSNRKICSTPPSGCPLIGVHERCCASSRK